MYSSYFIRLSLGLSFLSLTACSALYGDHGVFRGKSKDYLRTGAIEPIVVPEDMNSRSLEPLYAIPEVDPRDEFGDRVVLGDYEVPRPDAINTEKGKVGVKIQRLGERKWIFLNASTSQVWPRTQNFLSEYGIGVVVNNPNIGLIETGDVAFKNDPLKSRFKIFIEKGIHPETTEIHILHKQLSGKEQVGEPLSWPKTSDSIDRERQMLEELAGVLAESVSNNSASLLGQNVGGALKVEFLRGREEPTMRLRLFEERAKATVSHALEKEGFVLWDELAYAGLFYIGYNPAEDEGGMFSRFFSDSFPDEAPHSIPDLLQHLAPSENVQKTFANLTDDVSFSNGSLDAPGYIVLMQSAEQGMDVVIRDTSGKTLPRDQAKLLLRLIRKNLI